MTEKGKEVISFINDRVSCILDFVGKGMDSSQRDDFYKALTLIAGNLTSYVKAEAMQ